MGEHPTVDAPVGDLLKDRSVGAFLFAGFASAAAVTAQATALGKQVFDLTHHELDLGLLGLVEFAPAFLLVLVSGAVADRFDRRNVAKVAIGAQALCSLALAALARNGTGSLGAILGVVFVFGIARAFGSPATRALPPNIVERARLPRLIPLSSLAMQAALVVGPVLGGFLYVSGPAWPYIAAAASSAAAVVAFFFVELVPPDEVAPLDEVAPPTAVDPADAIVDVDASGEPERAPSRRATLREAVQGLGVIRREPILLGAISLDLFAVLFGGAVALLPAIAEQQLHVGAVGLGWLRAAGGMGSAVTGAFLAIRPRHRHVGVTLMVAVGIFGLATIGLGLTHSFALAFAALFVLAGADAVSVFIRSTISPLVVPDVVRGRVLAVENVFIGASNELGAFESGLAGQLIGTSGAVISGGIATVAVVVIWTAAFPSLRNIDRFEDLEPIEVAPVT
jgi:MFS family permease